MRLLEVTNYGMILPGKMLINLDQITKISLVPDSSNRYALVLASSDKVVLVSAEDMSRVLARVQTVIQR